ncbi:hypothetical protein C0992_009276 [Termitomyces sp. T32_za158]|nr:hypothetical protein C0992_009276 [Termitomyces sp. T32_za158]
MGAEPPGMHISKPTIYARDLSNVEVSTLKQMFEETLGSSEGTRISFTKEKGKAKRGLSRTAQIDFADITQAQKAFALANLRPIPNTSPPQILKLSISPIIPLPNPQGYPRLVKTSLKLTSAELYALIRPFGDLASVHVDNDLGAVVRFWTEDDAKAAEAAISSRRPKVALQAFDPSARAIRQHNRTNWLSKTIVVRYSELKAAAEKQPETNTQCGDPIPDPISPILSDTPTCNNDDPSAPLDKSTGDTKEEASQATIIETLLRNIVSFNEQLAKATENHQIESQSMKEDLKTLERERDELKIARASAQKEFEERTMYQQKEIECLGAQHKSLKEQHTAMESQYTILSKTLEAQCDAVIAEKEELRRQLTQVEHDRDDWRRKFEVLESRCKILELDRPLWNEAKRQKEKEIEESHKAQEAQKVKIEEMERKLRDFMEQEKEREREKMKQQREEAARKASEEEARKKREAEKARQAAWETATVAEFERCRKRDMQYLYRGRVWDNNTALERFNVLVAEFETLKFSENQPLMLANIPWPVLHPISYSSNLSFTFRSENITWEAVEKFFAHVRRTTTIDQYNKAVEKAHRLFHPDRWDSRRLLDTVQDPDLRKSLQSAGNVVAQAMTPIWRSSKDKF